MLAAKHKSILYRSLALVIVVALIAFAVGGQWKDLSSAIKEADWRYVALSVAVFGISLVLLFYRWLTLLKIQQIKITFKETVQLHLSGFFFNTTTPGAVSGDLVKIGTVIRRDPDNRLAAALSIFVDRLIGLVALLVFVILMIIPAFEFIMHESTNDIKLSVLIVASGCVVAFIFLGLWLMRRSLMKLVPVQKMVYRFQQKFPRLGIAVNQLVLAGEGYQKQWRTCLTLFFISILSHFFFGLSFYMLGLSLHLSISPVLFILSIQVSNALSAVVPLPGGLGLRDTIGKAFLLAAGCSSAKAVAAPLLYSGVILFWGTIGALVFLHWRATMAGGSQLAAVNSSDS